MGTHGEDVLEISKSKMECIRLDTLRFLTVVLSKFIKQLMVKNYFIRVPICFSFRH